MFRRLRTRRAIQKIERTSGLKHENIAAGNHKSIFRKNDNEKNTRITIAPSLIATFSEESETTTDNGIVDIGNHHNDDTIDVIDTTNMKIVINENVNDNNMIVDVDDRHREPYDVDVTIHTQNNDIDTDTDERIKLQKKEQEQEQQIQVMMEGLQNHYMEQLNEKDVMIDTLRNELETLRQDFLDNIVDMNVYEYEMSTIKEQMKHNEMNYQTIIQQLQNQNITYKEQLQLHATKLIQTQHEYYLVVEELQQKQQNSLFGFLSL